MSISAQRFKFLDKETNVAVQDFIKVTSNEVYNVADQVTATVAETTKEAEKVVKALSENTKEALASIESAVQNSEAAQEIQNAVNDAVDSLSDLELPDVVNDALNTLKSLDLDGLKSFFKDALSIGKMFLCNNLDFLKMFSLGFSFSGNILSGLLMGLSFSWLDRICKPLTPEESKKGSPKSLLEDLFPFKGVKLTSDNILTEFKAIYNDHLNSLQPIITPSIPSTTTLITDVLNGNVTTIVSTIKEAEITSTQKNSFISALETELVNHLPGSTSYNNILEARAKLTKLPRINSIRRSNKIKYKNLNANLTLFSKNLTNTKITKPSFGISPTESSLYDKLLTFQTNAKSSTSLKTVDFKDAGKFDSSILLPTLTTAEQAEISNTDKSSNSHRTLGLHPTTEVFIT